MDVHRGGGPRGLLGRSIEGEDAGEAHSSTPITTIASRSSSSPSEVGHSLPAPEAPGSSSSHHYHCLKSTKTSNPNRNSCP